ncbi:phage minor head protein [Oscillospiraceae bacterium LCP25S3_E4]
MRSWDKEVEQSLLYDEKAVIKSLEKNYQSALKEVDDRIGSFAARISSGDNVQSAIYQMRYQQELKKQIEKSLENMQNNNYSTITDYLQSTYKNGFMGAQYTLHKQGIPLITPINQQSIVQALTLNSKISTGLYNRLGVDVEQFKHIITTEVSRGIATGSSWNQIAKQISNKGNVTFSNASRIARTEGHRIQSEAKIDAYTSAKTKGADIVKQWDSTLDGKTRDTHRKLDGQIRELDEDFEVNGMTVSAPGHFGDPAEDCNCRCCLLQRARWALDAEELKTLQDRAEYFGLDKSKDFEDFKDKYINAVAKLTESDIMNETIEKLKTANIEYNEVKSFENPLSETEIIERLGGGDMTSGSCSSLAFAYAGNKNNLDVLDFRGGFSQETFSKNSTINAIASLPNVNGTVIQEYNDFVAVNKLLKTVEIGKDYYLGAGQHASIIRKTENGFEYLELQSATNNGFKKLTTEVLKRRFGCKKSHSVLGNKYKVSNQLIECESLGNSKKFKEVLGYINTSEDKQKKGMSGSVK